MRRLGLAVPFVVVGVACGGSASTTGTYTVAFQSTDEAVLVESIEVHVYDTTTIAEPEACGHLLVLRNSGQDLPAAVVDVAPTPVCDLRSGGGTFTAPLGSVAVLVVARARDPLSGGQLFDLARGCATQRFSADAASITVNLALVSGRSVASTKCTSLSQHCGGGC